jgi:hypothetical protein
VVERHSNIGRPYIKHIGRVPSMKSQRHNINFYRFRRGI